jgi:hypothetical protein
LPWCRKINHTPSSQPISLQHNFTESSISYSSSRTVKIKTVNFPMCLSITHGGGGGGQGKASHFKPPHYMKWSASSSSPSRRGEESPVGLSRNRGDWESVVNGKIF